MNAIVDIFLIVIFSITILWSSTALETFKTRVLEGVSDGIYSIGYFSASLTRK